MGMQELYLDDGRRSIVVRGLFRHTSDLALVEVDLCLLLVQVLNEACVMGMTGKRSFLPGTGEYTDRNKSPGQAVPG
jgi:hypothetical protein